ncbi:MAG: YfiR family protein [Saprospiraceae bacterium]
MKGDSRHISPLIGRVNRSASLIISLYLLGSFTLHAQVVTATEYKIQAVFLYNFSHFVEWPTESFTDYYDPFIIGIIGEDPFGAYIDEAVAEERIKSHILEVERYNDVCDVRHCHILYINQQDPDKVRLILSEVADKNILTVSDTPDFIRWGGLIRFFTENNKIRLEINNTAARKKHIMISSKLLRVATVQ